jgi:hypothetical protein
MHTQVTPTQIHTHAGHTFASATTRSPSSLLPGRGAWPDSTWVAHHTNHRESRNRQCVTCQHAHHIERQQHLTPERCSFTPLTVNCCTAWTSNLSVSLSLSLSPPPSQSRSLHSSHRKLLHRLETDVQQCRPLKLGIVSEQEFARLRQSSGQRLKAAATCRKAGRGEA